MILCYKCGVVTEPNEYNLCLRCTTANITIANKLRTSVGIDWCKGCERYLNKPRTWIKYEWGSRELLIYCIKCNSSLNNFDIIDSNFNYTEEHSKRISIQVTLEANGFKEEKEIRYIIRNKQCPDCEKIEAKQHWRAVVQVRHRLCHPRIFILLEQLIIKNKMYSDATNIKMRKEGIDFYFSDRTDANKLVNFIENVLPVKIILSERLISKDIQNSKSNYKFSFSVEIASLCIDDLVILDKAFAQKLGIGNIVIVKKVSTNIILLDPYLLKEAKVSNQTYWSNKEKFKVLTSSKNFDRFNLIEIERKPIASSVFLKLVYASVVKENSNDIIETKCHLGKTLKDDDVLLGYDLRNFNSSVDMENLPEIVIVRKAPSKDIKWKKTISSDEYYYFIDDVKKDKEIISNLCEIQSRHCDLLESVERLLN